MKFLIAVLFLLSEIPARSNVTGIDAQNFNAITDGLDFVTVHSSETLEPGIFNLGLFLNYAANSLPVINFNKDGTNQEIKPKDRIATADFNFGVGLLKFLDVGMSVPNIVYQKVETEELHGEFVQQGVSELRTNAKIRFLGDKQGGIAAVLSANYNLLQDNPYMGQNGLFIYNGEFVADTTVKKFALGANIGYRKRMTGDKIPSAPIEPAKDQYIASTAVSYHFPSVQTKLIWEVFGAWPTKATENNYTQRANSSLETLLGVKTDVTPHLALHTGAGTELQQGVASPDWRVYVGLNYVFGPVWGSDTTARVSKKLKTPKSFDDTSHQESDETFQQAPKKGEETIVVRNINFAFDRDNVVLPGSKEVIAEMVKYIRKDPPYKSLVIEGHTDSFGSEEYNQDLSERRAQTIRKYMVEALKEEGGKITAAGMGMKHPVADNGNYQGRKLNRRVEFKITR